MVGARRGGEVEHHERLAIAAEAGLQQVGELGVAVGDVLVLVRQPHEHVAQRAQALVDRLHHSRESQHESKTQTHSDTEGLARLVTSDSLSGSTKLGVGSEPVSP